MMEHISVLLHETVEGLNVKPDGIYVDGTLGRAGHSSLIVKSLSTGHLFAFDKDQVALDESRIRLQEDSDKVTFIHDDFKNMKKVLNELGINKVDGVMLDLGVSSPQFDDANRGFSYRYDAKLDMRMDQSQTLTAYEVVNHYDYHDLVRILFQYGEEKFAKQIARSIERNREIKPIETTFELVDVIKQALPMKVLNKKGHPAKQTFQAIRLEVNGELESLKQGLKDAIDLLNIQGRCSVITFHSLEDRIVKDLFNEVSTVPQIDKRIPILPNQIEKASYRCITKKPILASEEELAMNNRSHSAKLRVLERINE
ncbi:MAG: 16S rRNA (cytosine(1402)-N(4))-methyltransferase RsmH [Anaerorhabdus sp.]|uniref:16S rRNA (cytosine(1402)-N(4))-methyltransferase RsmH n=1 Tax=Anaerorhabdus sp. TaxID=1872524 RepID=UPI003A8AFED9